MRTFRLFRVLAAILALAAANAAFGTPAQLKKVSPHFGRHALLKLPARLTTGPGQRRCSTDGYFIREGPPLYAEPVLFYLGGFDLPALRGEGVNERHAFTKIRLIVSEDDGPPMAINAYSVLGDDKLGVTKVTIRVSRRVYAAEKDCLPVPSVLPKKPRLRR